ncbi:TadE-like protein [Mobilisporobacter senegalensis]|uniref:TadE-like protein n=1 Tax=Mobilisporobacter senegalensis TaxID=1329262 RepID=A0A3N1XCC3_9FIRM|nr:TadE/TadG family type IV pilus assembly protein [Mobilisporobacter senegalensis]ROR23668.1 TadE-like protein [Mobilisporobacter senegalensis]
MLEKYLIYTINRQQKKEEKINNEDSTFILFVSRASYTVEAALIIPIIIFVIIALIYMGFYLHDKSRIQAILNANIIQAGLMVKHEWNGAGDEIDYINIDNRGIYFPVIGDTKQEREEIGRILEEQLSINLYIAEINDIVVDADHSNIAVRVEVDMNISILKVKEFFTGSGTNFTILSKGRVHYPAEFIRQFDVVEGIVDDLKGYDEILKKLKAFIK